MPADTGKIKEQVEYYFSNSNYAKDKFLQETAIKNNKCVPITILLTFERMKRLGVGVEDVKKALEGSGIVEVVGDSLKKIETQEYLEYRSDKDIAKRIVHMEGFDTDAMLDDLKELLRRHCSPVKILMRRSKEKEFTGSCFVEFATAKEAEDALSLKIEAARPRDGNEESSKRSRLASEYVKIVPKLEYLASKPETKETANERFIKKVKADFIPKLFAYEASAPLTIEEVKGLIPNVAFVDTTKRIVRMKYVEEWDAREFGSDDKKVTLTRMGEEQAQEYVSNINIKKLPKKK